MENSLASYHKGIKVSIVTACYKSEGFLERIYRSIINNGYEQIEWITVDDCSPDDTLKKLHELRDRKEIEVKIVALPQNTHAFGAVKAGIAIATGRFTIILDHDDEIMPGALTALLACWDAMAPGNEKLHGIWARCVDENNNLLGRLYEEAPLICTYAYFVHILHCREECLLMADTALLKEFYTLSNNQLVKTNGSIWNKMGQDYRCIFSNVVLRKYYTNIPTSHMNQKTIRNSLSYSYQEQEYLNDNYHYFWKDLSFFLKKILVYLNFSYHAGVPVSEAIGKLRNAGMKAAAVLMLPVFPLLLLKNRFLNNRRYD